MPRKKIDFKTNKDIEKKILAGISPKGIADELIVSIAHVHNVKKDMENRGVKIPEIKKGRPWAPKESGDPDISAQALTGKASSTNHSLRNKKKGISINIDSFPAVPVRLEISKEQVTVHYGDIKKTLVF